MKVTYFVNVTPTLSMMLMLRLFLHSLEVSAGGDYLVMIVIDAEYDVAEVRRMHPWLGRYSCEFRNTPRLLNAEFAYIGNFIERFRLVAPTEAVVYCDADILVLASLQAMCRQALYEEGVYGVPAGTYIAQDLRPVLAACGVSALQDHTMESLAWGVWGEAECRNMLPHYNCGMLFTTRQVGEEIGRFVVEDSRRCRELIASPLYIQIAIGIGLMRAGIRCNEISFGYNMTAHDIAVNPDLPAEPYFRRKQERMRRAMIDPKVVHFCVDHPLLKKSRDFADEDQLAQLMQRNPEGSALLFHLQRFLTEEYENIFK